MIFAVDVHYPAEGGAVAAGLLFRRWNSPQSEQTVVRRIDRVAEYRPGRFFERELPCILTLMQGIKAPKVIVVDGYVWLGAERRPGLGAYLHDAVGLPVVGVAKTPFRGTPESAAILRGHSVKPLFVTAIGMDERDARARVLEMHGEHRIPTLLAEVDRVCRNGRMES